MFSWLEPWLVTCFFFYAHGIKAVRATEDIGLAFALASWSHFEKLRTSLLSSDVFRPHPRGSHKLSYRSDVVVDLIPFGGLENADGTISWPPHGDTVMSVLGFEEALKSSIDALLPSGHRRGIALLGVPLEAVAPDVPAAAVDSAVHFDRAGEQCVPLCFEPTQKSGSMFMRVPAVFRAQNARKTANMG